MLWVVTTRTVSYKYSQILERVKTFIPYTEPGTQENKIELKKIQVQCAIMNGAHGRLAKDSRQEFPRRQAAPVTLPLAWWLSLLAVQVPERHQVSLSALVEQQLSLEVQLLPRAGAVESGLTGDLAAGCTSGARRRRTSRSRRSRRSGSAGRLPGGRPHTPATQGCLLPASCAWSPHPPCMVCTKLAELLQRGGQGAPHSLPPHRPHTRTSSVGPPGLIKVSHVRLLDCLVQGEHLEEAAFLAFAVLQDGHLLQLIQSVGDLKVNGPVQPLTPVHRKGCATGQWTVGVTRQ